VAQNKNARHVTAAISCILKSRFEFFFRNRFSRSASDLDVDPPRFLPPSNCYVGGGISSRRPRGDTLLALFPEFSAWVRSSANFCSFPVLFLLVPAYPGCPGSKAVKRSLLLLLLSRSRTASVCLRMQRAQLSGAVLPSRCLSVCPPRDRVSCKND